MIAWIDIETTGIDPERHEIIEIAIVVTKLNLTPETQHGLNLR